VITNRLLGTLGLAVALGGAAAATTATDAAADVRIHFGGTAHVRIGGFRYRPFRPFRPYRPYQPVIIGGHVWVGGYYYERPFAQPPPPPPPSCGECDSGYYAPIAPAPVTYATAPIVVEDPLPRFGIGAFLGGVSVGGEHEGKDVGLVAQLRLFGPLLIEAEIAKNTLADGERVDRRYLVGADLELGAHRKLAPYLAAGVGTTQVEVAGGWQDDQAIAEVGGGLRWRLSDRLTLFGDIRFGSSQSANDTSDPPTSEPTPAGATARSVIPSSDGEDYSRVRLGGMVTF
jgi:hypothetical protein